LGSTWVESLICYSEIEEGDSKNEAFITSTGFDP